MEEIVDTIMVNGHGQTPARNNSPSGNPFACNICGKCYTRIDHLARHYRSHSHERPFACDDCGKTFARIDLLKRHAAKHDDSGQPSRGASVGSRRRGKMVKEQQHRPRAQRACQACADAKARCEGNTPCSRCQHKSIDCEYPPSRSKKTVNPTSRVETRSSRRPEHPTRTSTTSATTSATATATAPATTTADGQTLNISQDHPHPQQDLVHSQMAESLGGDQYESLNRITTHPNDFNLPTPSTFDQVPMPSSEAYDHEFIDHLDDVPSAVLLRDGQLGVDHISSVNDLLNDDAFPRDILDFGVDMVLDSPILFDGDLQLPFGGDYQLPMQGNLDDMETYVPKSGIVTPGLKSKLNIMASAQAFKESLWLWTPARDDHGAAEQRNLSLPWDSTLTDHRSFSDPSMAHFRMNNAARGKVLAMVLRTCESAIYSHVVSNFPSTELLTKLIFNFADFHSRSEIPYIHIPTTEVTKEYPEFVSGLIAHGAAISQDPQIRKLGFALQEAIRMANPLEFERDNRLTRELRPLQSFALQLDVGLWSGNRRKMEISESFAMPLITMVRRAGHFRAVRPSEVRPEEADTGDTLESKWRAWAQLESCKRLAWYLFYRDTRSSMSLLSQPLISYAELTAAPPCHNSLWEANSALQWKTLYRQQLRDGHEPVHTRRAFLDDSEYIFRNQDSLDADVCLLLATATVWPQLWQYREMITTAKTSRSGDNRHQSLALTSRRQELTEMLEHIIMNAREWQFEMKSAIRLLHEQCSMHLCVSLEDVQLLAGKQGEEEALRIFPSMKSWVDSAQARQALFHAGQLLQAARDHSDFMLRDASAVAVYHASLIFWVYAVTSKDEHTTQSVTLNSRRSVTRSFDFVRLDSEQDAEVRRFLVLGRGVPCIQGQFQTGDSIVVRDVPLSEPAEVMKAITGILQKQYRQGARSYPPLIENLGRLMQSLGKAYFARRPR